MVGWEFFSVDKPSFKKSECSNGLIYNVYSWLFRLIFRIWKNQPVKGWVMLVLRLRKKYFRLRKIKICEGEILKRQHVYPNASSTFLFSSSRVENCWRSVGWFFYFYKIRLKSQESALKINWLYVSDFLKDVFASSKVASSTLHPLHLSKMCHFIGEMKNFL